MTDQNRSRPVIDLDELERQLREAAAPRQPAPQAAGREDPLAELARIVGQDDVSRGSWRQARPAAPVAGAMPAAPAAQRPPVDDFEAELAALTRGEPFTPPEPAVPPPPRAAEPAAPRADDGYDDWNLRPAPADYDDRVVPIDGRQSMQHRPAPQLMQESEPVYEAQGHLPPHDEVYEEIAPKPRRKGLYAAATVMGVAVVGVVAALAMRGTGTSVQTASAPPVIKADSGPMKARPENPGGVEVPNQDRAIYTRKPEDAKGVKVVGGEEQPVDVAAKVQQARPPVAPVDPSTTTGATLATGGGTPASAVELPKPPQTTAAVPGLGEPRRVRTVSVRPDGTIVDAASDAPAPLARTAALGAAQLPSAAPAAPVPAPAQVNGATPVAAPKKPEVPAAAPAPVASAARPAADAGATPAAPRAAPVSPAPRPAQVAAVAPAAAAPAEAAGGGGFTVQLAAPASEQEARDTAGRLERRFASELGGMKPFVRRAEVNGRTIYRVRVGNLTRDDATSLCTRVQSAGGQCFVARN